MAISTRTLTVGVAAGAVAAYLLMRLRKSRSTWKILRVPNPARPEAFFTEAQCGDKSHRMPEEIWPEQPTATPGPAGAAEHEAWLMANLRYRADDLVVATYPKCGTTLTEQIVLLLLNGGDANALDPLCKNSANSTKHSKSGKVWPEGCVVPDGYTAAHPPRRPPKEEFEALTLSRFNALPAPRVIKTHASVDKLVGRAADGALGAARYIVVTRNPLDACVSCYYHAWNPAKNGWPFEAFARAWLAGIGNGQFGCWFAFHSQWLRRTQTGGGDAHMLWVQYEDIVAEPAPQIARIASFIGVEPAPDLVARVVAGSHFDAMKAAAVKAEAKGGRTHTSAHLRVGGIGDWRNHFTPALEADFRAAFKLHMRGSGYTCDIGDGEQLVAPP